VVPERTARRRRGMGRKVRREGACWALRQNREVQIRVGLARGKEKSSTKGAGKGNAYQK